MTYREKFEASQHRAHYQNIATKILREMATLRSRVDNSNSVPRRWVWELIQNAKDVHAKDGVKIKIEFLPNAKEPSVIFRHNGTPFSADNIRFLIEQVSSKDRSKDEQGKPKETGKFGTGFLATHLLSKIVRVEGVAKEPNLPYRKFDLELDRSGSRLEQIITAVQRATQSMEELDERPIFSDYDEGDFNTAFYYFLKNESSVKVAKSGLNDLDHCLPYSLILVDEIKSVEVSPDKRFYRKENYKHALDDLISLVHIEIEGEVKCSSFCAAVLTEGLTSIVVPVRVDGNAVELRPVGQAIPRLFCDFPLIGTERFPFPVIINSPKFNPTDPRDGVFLNTTQETILEILENKVIIEEAVGLYFHLLQFATKNNWGNLHLLVPDYRGNLNLDWLDDAWFRNQVIAPIRKELLLAEIVRTSKGKIASILSRQNGSKNVWFPSSAKKEVRDQLWSCANYWFPGQLPRKSDVELWHQIKWNDCGALTVDQLASFIEHLKTTDELQKVLGSKKVIEWINEYHAVLQLEQSEYDSIVNRRAIYPNQNGCLCKKASLYEDSGNIGDEFKELLKLLGIDIRAELLDTGVIDNTGTKGSRDQAYAVREITSEVGEKANDREVAKSYRPAFKKLLLYFQKNQSQAKTLFPTLYRNKHFLYDDDQILENETKAEQLDELMNEFNVKEISELRDLLSSKQPEGENEVILPITQEIIASMGITSVEEWQKALEDKDLAVLFSHKPIPSTEKFVIAHAQIAKCKAKVIEHLRTLPNYKLDHMDETALTILAGVLKDGEPISIVIRPAYGGEVIIFYDSERDVLDYERSELWIDDGKEVRQITLGHILKKARIVKFPV